MKLVMTSVIALAVAVGVANATGSDTYIDPGNRALIIDYYGPPGVGVCVGAKDLNGNPVNVHLYREADPGGFKDLDMSFGERWLDTKGVNYKVYVENTNPFPIYGYACGGGYVGGGVTGTF